MTDLTKIEKPFGILDPETQRALEECGGPWEIFGSGDWQSILRPSWLDERTYRQAPNPVTYPQPPWEVINKRWNWFAKDANALGWFYEHKPEIVGAIWGIGKNNVAYDTGLLSFDYGTCDWKDSLVRRPE